jgi:hypothetical protein
MKKFGVLLMLVILAVCLAGTVRADDPNTDTNSLPGANLLVNASFEEPGPALSDPCIPLYGGNGYASRAMTGAKRWWRWAGGTSTITDVNYIENDAANAHSGTDYIKVKHVAGGGWIGFCENVIDHNDSNDIHPVVANYTQSIYARSADISTARVRFKLEFYRAPNDYYPAQITWYLSPIYSVVNNAWKRCQYSFHCPAGTQKFHASYYVGDGITEAETVYFDDANLQEGGAISACDNARYDAEANSVNGNYWTRIPGDLNDDCYVDIKDLGIWVADWLKDCALGTTCR